MRTYIHTLPTRIWHWINALGFLVMIATGVQIRYIGAIDLMSFRTAVLVHNFTGFVLIASFVLWLTIYIVSSRIRGYHAKFSLKGYFVGTFRQVIYYAFGIFRGDPEPFTPTANNKFNPLQSTIYHIVMMVLFPIQIITGLMLWDLKRFQSWVDFFGGVRVVDTVHVLVFIAFVNYILIHVYLGTLGHTRLAHYKAMMTGYEDLDAETPAE